MQISLKTRTDLLEKLLSQLKEFGLDARDWRLVQEGRERARLIHRRDRSFIFVGAIDFRQGTWKRLQLESL